MEDLENKYDRRFGILGLIYILVNIPLFVAVSLGGDWRIYAGIGVVIQILHIGAILILAKMYGNELRDWLNGR
jgi:hypothetical protein